MALILRRVGRYELLREIGQGGMATVYLARQTDLERDVALKELSALHATDPATAERFLRESRMAGSLSHPNIVTVHDYFEHIGTPYISMEYIRRGSLRPFVGRLTLAQVGGVLEGLLAGIQHAANRGIVHRDLKPENVMVTEEGSVKIADFGIARALNRTGLASRFLTSQGSTIGTPTYMAPEQAMARDVGTWTDLYSLGIMAYELTLGRVPFHDSDTPLSMLVRHISDTIPSPRTIDPDLDPQLSDWIERLLEKEPDARPKDAQEAWDGLEEILIRLLGPRWHREARIPEGAPKQATEATPRLPTPTPDGQGKVEPSALATPRADSLTYRPPDSPLRAEPAPPPAAPAEESRPEQQPEPSPLSDVSDRPGDREGDGARDASDAMPEAPEGDSLTHGVARARFPAPPPVRPTDPGRSAETDPRTPTPLSEEEAVIGELALDPPKAVDYATYPGSDSSGSAPAADRLPPADEVSAEPEAEKEPEDAVETGAPPVPAAEIEVEVEVEERALPGPAEPVNLTVAARGERAVSPPPARPPDPEPSAAKADIAVAVEANSIVDDQPASLDEGGSKPEPPARAGRTIAETEAPERAGRAAAAGSTRTVAPLGTPGTIAPDLSETIPPSSAAITPSFVLTDALAKIRQTGRDHRLPWAWLLLALGVVGAIVAAVVLLAGGGGSTPLVVNVPSQIAAPATSAAGARVTFTPKPSAREADGGSIPAVCDRASGSTFPLGLTKVTCSATDTAGHKAMATFTVTVADEALPSLTVPADITTGATTAGRARVVYRPKPSARDAVDGRTQVDCDRVSGSTFPLGATRVTCTTTDKAGNKAVRTFTVTITRSAPPTVTVPANITAEATSTAGARVTYTATAISRPSGTSLPVSCQPPSGSMFPLRSTVVTCSAATKDGVRAAKTFNVSVADTVAPAITVPADITATPTGASGAPVSFSVSARDAIDGSVQAHCDRASGSTFPAGVTRVTCTAADSSGNRGAKTFTVSVRPSAPPSITVPASFTVEATGSAGGPATYAVSARDAAQEPIGVRCDPASGSIFPPGTTTVTCTATDRSGNSASKSFTVTVVEPPPPDTDPPLITVPAPRLAQATSRSGAAVSYAASAVDKVDGPTPVSCTPESGSTFRVGVTTVTCTATDKNGNSASKTFTVTVVLIQ